MTGRVRAALGFLLALALGSGAFGAPSEERATSQAAPIPEAKTPEGQTAPPESTRDAKKGLRLGPELSSDAPFVFDARSMQVIPDERRVSETLRLRGNVTVTQGELKLSCDLLEAYFPEGYGQSSPQKFVASGDVHVVKGEAELRCTRAQFEENTCIALCLSSEPCESAKWPEQPARFRKGQGWMEGRELEFNQCTGEMFARCGARAQVVPRAKEHDAAPAAPEAPAAPAAPAEGQP
jgi:hypothetical protein